MRRHRPAWNQGVFTWVWSDPSDDRPDLPEDDLDDEATPPLRARVRGRHEPRRMSLWGTPLVIGKSARRDQ